MKKDIKRYFDDDADDDAFRLARLWRPQAVLVLALMLANLAYAIHVFGEIRDFVRRHCPAVDPHLVDGYGANILMAGLWVIIAAFFIGHGMRPLPTLIMMFVMALQTLFIGFHHLAPWRFSPCG